MIKLSVFNTVCRLIVSKCYFKESLTLPYPQPRAIFYHFIHYCIIVISFL